MDINCKFSNAVSLPLGDYVLCYTSINWKSFVDISLIQLISHDYTMSLLFTKLYYIEYIPDDLNGMTKGLRYML